MDTSRIAWKTWTDANGVLGDLAHDPTNFRTYFRLPDQHRTTGMFLWRMLGEAGEIDAHSRAIAWGQIAPQLVGSQAALGVLAAYGAVGVCMHLELSDCQDCAAASVAELSDDALAEYEVIRLDLAASTDARNDAVVDLFEKLAQLVARYDYLYAEQASATEMLDEVKTGIKAAAAMLRPGAARVRIVSNDLEHDLTVVRGSRKALDTKLIRRLCEQAGVSYDSLTRSTPTTTLKAAK